MESIQESTNRAICPSCNGENEKKAQFCVHCGNPFPRKRRFLFRRRYVLFGVIGLIFAGTMAYFLMGGLESKLAGKVNGESITRKEFSKKVDRAKKIYEYRYGQGLFEGQSGKENLNRLKTEILDEMITEKFLLQEARKAGFTSAPEEEIEKYVDTIKKQKGLSEVDLQKMIGGSIEDFKEELRMGWMISQFIEKAVVKGDQTNGESLFGQWLVKAKASARIETYEKIEPAYTAKASCCKSGCGGGRAQLLDPKMEQEAKAKALEYYERKTQKKGAEAKVTNFGCHIQVDIIEGGKVIVSLTYRQGEVQEI